MSMILTFRRLAVALSAFSLAVTAQATSYTWCGGGAANADGSRNWSDPANWLKNGTDVVTAGYPGKTDKGAASTGDVAIIPNDTQATIVFTEALKLTTLDLNKTGLGVTFKGGVANKLTLSGNSASAGLLLGTYNDKDAEPADTQNKIVLDGVAIENNSQVRYLAYGATLTLKNGADIYLSGFGLYGKYYYKGKVEVLGQSTFRTSSNIYVSLDGEFVIDDSTLRCGNVFNMCYCDTDSTDAKFGGGRVTFRGTRPVLVTAGNLGVTAKPENRGMDFDFEVPVGGYEAIPIQLCGNNQPAYANAYKGDIRFNILPSSPALSAGSKTTTALLSTPKGVYRPAQIKCTNSQVEFHYEDYAGNVQTDADKSFLFVFTMGSGAPATRTVTKSSLSNVRYTSVSRHVVTVTGQLAGLANDGTATEVELWAGTANDASKLSLVDTKELTAAGLFELVYTAALSDVEKTFYFQIRMKNKEGETVVYEERTDVFNATTLDQTTYTWKADGDGNWSGNWEDPNHWDDGLGNVSKGFPQLASATARFPAGHKIVVTFGSDGTARTVGTLDASAAGVDLTLKGSEQYGVTKILTVSTLLNLTGEGNAVTLDNVALKVSSGTVSPGFHSTLTLTNGADVALASIYYALDFCRDTAVKVTDGARLSVSGEIYFGATDSLLLIDGATVEAKGNFYIGRDAVNSGTPIPGGRVVFAGKNPKLYVATKDKLFCKLRNDDETRFDFLVPVGGYAEAPISAISTMTKSFASDAYAGSLHINVLAESPAVRTAGTVNTTLVDWPVAVTTGKISLDGVPDATTDSLAYADGNKKIVTTVVGSVHADRLTVASSAENIGTPSPDYGVHDGVTEATTCTASATVETDDYVATCLGYRLVTYSATEIGREESVVEDSALSVDVPAGQQAKLVWRWDVKFKLTTAAVGDSTGTVTWNSAVGTYTATAGDDDYEFQYWYGDVPHELRYTNPLPYKASAGGKLTAFFGKKVGATYEAKADKDCDWFDATAWTPNGIPGTNDTAVVWGTSNTKRKMGVDSFFAVGNLTISNKYLCVAAKTLGGYNSTLSRGESASTTDNDGFSHLQQIGALDSSRTFPIGFDVFGDLTLDCYNKTYTGGTSHSAIIYVGGLDQQANARVNVTGDLDVRNGSIDIAAGVVITNHLSSSVCVGGAGRHAPYTDLNEFYKGGNYLKVGGTTTIRTSTITGNFPNYLRTLNDYRSGAAVHLDLQDVVVEAGSAISAYAGGYGRWIVNGLTYTMCPGGFCNVDNVSGGSYGGLGGGEKTPSPQQTTWVTTYGYANAPFYPGSNNGGNGGYDGRGGGTIRLDCARLTLNGSLLANGRRGAGNKGGGAGGGIWINCTEFVPGDSCLVHAEGGDMRDGTNSGGGGGRIALGVGLTDEQMDELFESASHTATDVNVSSLADVLGARVSVAGGVAHVDRTDGQPGTAVYLVNTAGKKTIVIQGDPANYGSPTPAYGTQVYETGTELDLVAPADSYVSADQRSRRRCTGYTIVDEGGTTLVDSPEQSGTFTVSANATVTWKLSVLEHKLSARASLGGTITGVPENEWLGDGTAVSLTAVPSEGYRFAGWYGEVSKDEQASATLAFALTRGRSVKALFVPLAETTATWTGEGDGTNWEDPANWSGSTIPGPATAVVLPATARVKAGFALPIEVASLLVEAEAELTVENGGTFSTFTQTLDTAKETDYQPAALSVAGQATVRGKLTVGRQNSLSSFAFTVGGDLAVEQGATLTLAAGYRDGLVASSPTGWDAGGGSVRVGGLLSVETNAIVKVWCDGLSGAPVVFDVGAAKIANGAKVDADAAGWFYTVINSVTYCRSPNAADCNYLGYAGGTYAGVGGQGKQHEPSHVTYGFANAPFLPGSSGMNSSEMRGGGIIRINCRNTFRLYGTITACGKSTTNLSAGGGSGGSIWITCGQYRDSATACLNVSGGDSTYNGGGGGGGRVSVAQHLTAEQLASLQATGTCAGRGLEIKDLLVEATPIKAEVRCTGGLGLKDCGVGRVSTGGTGTATYLSGARPGLLFIVR